VRELHPYQTDEKKKAISGKEEEPNIAEQLFDGCSKLKRNS
tara:strand:+ start:294 stop:416 length:123 start_codon:yes stop_codon:yes gene_type:complete